MEIGLSKISRASSYALFYEQKLAQCPWQTDCKLLPGEHLASGAEGCGPYAPHDPVPLFEQILPAGIEQNTETEIESVGREHIPQQLIRGIVLTFPWQFAALEDFFEIPVLIDDSCFLSLKIPFR